MQSQQIQRLVNSQEGKGSLACTNTLLQIHSVRHCMHTNKLLMHLCKNKLLMHLCKNKLLMHLYKNKLLMHLCTLTSYARNLWRNLKVTESYKQKMNSFTQKWKCPCERKRETERQKDRNKYRDRVTERVQTDRQTDAKEYWKHWH